MNYLNVRKAFIKGITKKYQKDYKIKLNSWMPNPYYKLKYYYIWESASILSYLILKTGLTANFVTIINLILAIVALFAFAFDINDLKIFSILIFFSKQILDNVDGFVARQKNITSKFGHTLDEICGHVYYFCIYLSLVFHVYYQTNFDKKIIFFGFTAFFLDLTNFTFSKKVKNIKKILKKKSFEITYLFLSLINFDARTIKTDLLLFLIILELSYNQNIFTQYLIYLFLIPKIIRNLYNIKKTII